MTWPVSMFWNCLLQYCKYQDENVLVTKQHSAWSRLHSCAGTKFWPSSSITLVTKASYNHFCFQQQKLINQIVAWSGSIDVLAWFVPKPRHYSCLFVWLGFTSHQHSIDLTATFQLYWWRKTSGALPCFIPAQTGTWVEPPTSFLTWKNIILTNIEGEIIIYYCRWANNLTT
jgi:hypothetical protein